MVKKSMLHYRDYARTNSADLLRLIGKTSWKTLTCKVLASSFIENSGNGAFSISALPVSAQFAPVNGMLAEDVNLDGNVDLILVGNQYDGDVVNGRYDASIGTVLINSGNNTFTALKQNEHSFVVRGDARGISRLELSDNRSLLLITQNNDKLVSYVIDQHNDFKRLRLDHAEISVLATLSNGGKRKIEFPAGGSYLSQGARSIVITPDITTIEAFDSRGNKTRTIRQDDLRTLAYQQK
jgi:hypothetical protein